MTVEAQIFAALSALVNARVYPDIGLEGGEKPYITYQQVGGDAINYTEIAIPDKKNARMQVNVWALTRLEASALADQVEDALRGLSDAETLVLGARVALYEEDTKLRGTRQDFSIWY
jgi:hypothetical protein